MKKKFFFSPADCIGESFWQPSVDIYRTHKGWLLKFDLAGVRLEDIEVLRHADTLTVQGVRRDLLEEGSCDYYSLEISYSRFKRCITLPMDLESSTIRMDYKDGMLLIRVENED